MIVYALVLHARLVKRFRTMLAFSVLSVYRAIVCVDDLLWSELLPGGAALLWKHRSTRSRSPADWVVWGDYGDNNKGFFQKKYSKS